MSPDVANEKLLVVPASLIEELRDTVGELRREVEQLRRERDEYKRMAEMFQRELERLRDQQKTPREHVDQGQIQLVFEPFAKQLLENSSASPHPPAASTDSTNEPKPPPKRTPHGRNVLPEHLPVQTLVLTPKGLPEGAVSIDQEISWRLGFRPASFYRLKIVRPVFVVAKDKADACSDTTASLHEGDVPGWSASTKPASEAAASEQTDHVVDARAAVPIDVASDAKPAPSTVCTDHPSNPPCSASKAHVLETTAGANGSLANTTVVCAPAPDEMIPRGLPTADLLARIITGKFGDMLPLHRQERIFARAEVHITRGTMCGWLDAAHELCRLVVDAMLNEAMTSAHFIGTDATGVLVQANERCKKGHFWVLVADQDHVLYRYSKRHSSDEPKAFFKGFRGTVVADASNVYDALFRLPEGPNEAGCNAHARRYFYKALSSDRDRALVGIGFFNRLFELEREWAKLPPQKRLVMRQERSAPVTEALRRWRDEQLASSAVADGTPIRRALNYLFNHWGALTRFLQDGKIPISNNRSELELRRLVIGRANWLFCGSDDTAPQTCTFVSLVASCEMHKLDPEAYLRDLFRVLPVWPRNRVLELAPKYWTRTRSRLDSAELALPLGPITVPPPLSANQAEKADAHEGAVAHGS